MAQTQNSVFSRFWSLDVPGEGAGWLGSWWGLPPWLLTVSSDAPHCHHEGPTLVTYPPKADLVIPPNIITWGTRVSTHQFHWDTNLQPVTHFYHLPKGVLDSDTKDSHSTKFHGPTLHVYPPHFSNFRDLVSGLAPKSSSSFHLLFPELAFPSSHSWVLRAQFWFSSLLLSASLQASSYSVMILNIISVLRLPTFIDLAPNYLLKSKLVYSAASITVCVNV